MGNDLHSASDNRGETHTNDEEQPLNILNARQISISDLSDKIASNLAIPAQQMPVTDAINATPLPFGWEKRTDPQTHKPYYVDHNTHRTQWNPPNTLTKVGNEWTEHNDENDNANVILYNSTNKYTHLSDCYDIENPANNPYILFNDTLPNTIRLKPRNKNTQWISVFGTKIVTKGEYKRWQIKILPLDSEHKSKHKNKSVKVVIGIVDIDSISERERGNAIESEYWLLPRIGYGYGGDKGKKYHINKKGKSYGSKYGIGDTVSVELNRTNNRFILHNDLRFYTNENVNGLAFNIDNDRNYVLAVAFCEDSCQLQICD